MIVMDYVDVHKDNHAYSKTYFVLMKIQLLLLPFIMMDILPLDLDALVSEELNEEERERAETFHNGGRIGHIRLKVSNLERSIRFYHEKVGLDSAGTENWRSMGVAFLSAGGYHHHIAVNTLNSLNGEAHTYGEAGSFIFEIITPDKSSLERLGP